MVLKNVETQNGLFLFSKFTNIVMKKGSKIIVNNGLFRVGFAMNGIDSSFSHFKENKITLLEGSTLIINGDVSIAPGTSIIVNKNATCTFEGANVIAHNNLFYCHKRISVGFNSCTSWNCQFMDADGHQLYSSKGGGRFIEPIVRPLIIGKNVGFQMNVVVPRGVTIGDNALISCGVIVREDLPAESLIYVDQQIKIKKGIMTPYGKKLE